MITRAYQRHGVNGADDDGGQPKSDDGAAGVRDDDGLVLDGVPLSQSTARTIAKFEPFDSPPTTHVPWLSSRQ
jgi:hypothetical protein